MLTQPTAEIGPEFDPGKLDTATPVLILGGRENALSLTRSYGRRGIAVRVSGPDDCWGMYSRYCGERFHIPSRARAADYWRDLLLAPGAERLEGSLLVQCSDEAIDFVASNREALATRYVLDHARAPMQIALLNKKRTLELAREAGIATPQFWELACETQLGPIRDQLQFPVMVKPLVSHLFYEVFRRKLFIVENGFDELAAIVRRCREHAVPVMVTEMVPGPDSLLSSYYTYIDDRGRRLFDYTKRIVRRFPVNRGLACYHLSDWLPETAEAGRRFFEGIGFSGFGNVEFKRDPRDGVLKIIESNARFTAAQELIVRSGAPVDLIYYCAATGQPAPSFDRYRTGEAYWYGLRDFLAFLELNRRGELGLREWIAGLPVFDHVSPLHAASDPAPSFGALAARAVKTARLLL